MSSDVGGGNNEEAERVESAEAAENRKEMVLALKVPRKKGSYKSLSAKVPFSLTDRITSTYESYTSFYIQLQYTEP